MHFSIVSGWREESNLLLSSFLSPARMWGIEKASPQLAARSARGRAQPLEKQVAPTLSIFAGDVRPFAGQTINVFAEESLASSAKADKASWANSSNLLFNWVIGCSGKAGRWRQLLGRAAHRQLGRSQGLEEAKQIKTQNSFPECRHWRVGW